MRVAIAGAGNVGLFIANDLCAAGHDVVLIEQNPSVVERAVAADGVTWEIADACEVNSLRATNLGECDIAVAEEDGQLVVTRPTDRKDHKSLHGLTRTLIANMVTGVTTGFTKTLEIQGVGYRAQLKGSDLELALGYSHPVPIQAPTGIEFEVPQPTRVVIKGNDKQQVGQVAAVIRKQRPPEPYKGKGVKYQGEVIRRKAGKAGGKKK